MLKYIEVYSSSEYILCGSTMNSKRVMELVFNLCSLFYCRKNSARTLVSNDRYGLNAATIHERI